MEKSQPDKEDYHMLKGIPSILSPELLKILMEMGHSDEIVIADGNFPSGTCAKRLIRCDGHNVPEVLDAILRFFPLDPYVEAPVALMQVVPGDTVETPIWDVYKDIVKKHEPVYNSIENIERFAFYERAKNAYAVIATSEKALYANIILKKGVVIEK
jgi:L-fucose mutarotase